MTAAYTEAGEYVFEEGQTGSHFFIIQEGLVEVEKSGKPLKTLKKGDYFGDLALLYSAPRSASIYCLQKTIFWVLQTRKFQEVLRTIKTNQFISNRKVLNNVKFFGIIFSPRTLLGHAEECFSHGYGSREVQGRPDHSKGGRSCQ